MPSPQPQQQQQPVYTIIESDSSESSPSSPTHSIASLEILPPESFDEMDKEGTESSLYTPADSSSSSSSILNTWSSSSKLILLASIASIVVYWNFSDSAATTFRGSHESTAAVMNDMQSNFTIKSITTTLHPPGKNSNHMVDDIDDDDARLLQIMKKRLQPRRMLLSRNEAQSTATTATYTLDKHQFLHLHHMKTGGTSLDGVVNCGLNRLRSYTAHFTSRLVLDYTNLHECSESHYATCKSGSNKACLDSVHGAAIMSYCAPLKDLSTPFEWIAPPSSPHSRHRDLHIASTRSSVRREGPRLSATSSEALSRRQDQDPESRILTPTFTNSIDRSMPPPKQQRSLMSTAIAAGLSPDLLAAPPLLHSAVTVLRHPVARVWSMYRFQTKNCYHCLPLTEIYAMIDAKNGSSTSKLTHMCQLQLLNHQTRNLLTASSADIEVPDSMDHVREAIASMQTVFTMIGLTEDMNNTARMVGMVFPWLAETMDWTRALDAQDDNIRLANATSLDATGSGLTCALPHANASPRNNRCGPDGNSHLDLPPVPDEATAAAILAHNDMDMQLYTAGMAQFALQKQALGL